MFAIRRINETINKISSPSWRGLAWGAVTGLLASGIYTLAYSIIFGVMTPLTLIMIAIGSPLAIPSATLIGAVTGWLIGAVLELFGEKLSLNAITYVSGAFCIFVAVLIYIPRWLFGIFPLDIFFFGVPSLIYVGLGVWMSKKLYREVPRPIQNNRVAIVFPLLLMVLSLFGWYFYLYETRGENSQILIPKGYTGLIAIGFDSSIGEIAKYEWIYRLYTIPPRGVLITQPSDPIIKARGGTREFYYIDVNGQKQKLRFFNWCDEDEMPKDEVIVCGDDGGYFKNYEPKIPFELYIVAPAQQAKGIQDKFRELEWYTGFDINSLFPEQ